MYNSRAISCAFAEKTENPPAGSSRYALIDTFNSAATTSLNERFSIYSFLASVMPDSEARILSYRDGKYHLYVANDTGSYDVSFDGIDSSFVF